MKNIITSKVSRLGITQQKTKYKYLKLDIWRSPGGVPPFLIQYKNFWIAAKNFGIMKICLNI